MDTITEAKSKAKARVRIKPRKKLVSIRLDPIIQQRADELANADKRSFSQYVELVLEQHIKEHDLKEQQTIKEQQELARHFKPGDVQGVWSAYDEFKAAEQLQVLLKNTKR